MMQETGPVQNEKTELEPTLLNMKESLSGIEGLIDKPVVKIEQGIVAMDQGFRSIVNSMGAGENMSEAIRKNLAGATIETIKMGGDAKSALNVQLDTLKVMGKNVTLSQDLTTELFAASQVSGRSIEELETGFLNAGMSLKDISKQMLVVRDVANNLGVNAKLVSDSVVKNLDKLNSYGFQGGVEGLARMAAKATALRVSMDSTFNIADKLMSPESAIEMSAALQRLGATSTDLLDPLKLMDLAQNNVPELQKQLGEMFKSYTYFDEKTKTFQIMPGARRQLKEIAGELGMNIDEVQRMALGTADLDKKLSEISFSGFEVSEDTKEMVANMATMSESGEYKIQTEEIGEDGKPVSKTIQEVMEKFKGDEAGLKEYLTGLDKSKQPKTIEEIAEEQLDVLTAIKKSGEALAASPGLAAGASKVGPQVLQSAKALSDNINEPLMKKLGPGAEGLTKTFDKTAEELKTAFEKLTSGDKDKAKEGGKEVLAAFGTLSKGIGTQLAGGIGESLGNYSEMFGIDIEEYKTKIGDAFLSAEERAAKLKEKAAEKLDIDNKKDDVIFPDEKQVKFPDSVNTQEIKTSSINVENAQTEEETKLVFPDNVESKEIRAGKIIVEEGINLTAPTVTPTPTIVTPEVGTKPTGQVEEETITNPLEDPQLKANLKQLQELVSKGLVGEAIASTGNEVLFNQQLPEITPTTITPEVGTKQTKEEPKKETEEQKEGFFKNIGDKITGIGDVAQNIKGLATFDQGTITNLIAAAGKEIIPQLAEISKLGEKEQGAALQNLVKETLTPGNALKLLGTENEGVGKGGEIDINAALSDAISENKELFQGEGAVDVKSITDMLEKNMGGIIDTAASTFKESGIAKLASKFLPKEMVGEEEGGLDKLVDQYAKTAKEMAESTDLDSDLIAESISQAAEGKTVDFQQIAMGSYDSALMGPQEELKNIATQEVLPEIKPEFELKINTSEVENLNVKNLNIGDSFDKLVSTIKLTPTDQTKTKIEPEKGAQLSKQEQIRQLEQQGLVGEDIASTDNKVYFKPQQQESLAAEQAMAQTTPKTPATTPTSRFVPPTVNPSINVEEGLDEGEKKPVGTTIDKISLTESENEGFEGVLSEPVEPIGIKLEEDEIEKTVQEAQQNQLDYLEELRQKEISKPKKSKGKFDNIKQKGESVETEEPSAYENYKKLLEEINNAKVVGQGKESFFLTPEMIEEGKKGSELIGSETQIPKTKIETKPSGLEIETFGKQKLVSSNEEYTPGQIGTEEGLTNIGRTATELGVKEEELTNIAVQKEETEPITELKLDTSEVNTLNVKNLNIGEGIDKTIKKEENVGANLNLQEPPKVTPTVEPTINVESGLPELVGELPEIKEVKKTKPEPRFFEKINNFVQELKTEPVKPVSEEIIEPKKPDTGFRFFDKSTFKKETPTPTPTFAESVIPPVEKTEEPKSDLLKGFESSLNKLSELKLPEINLLGKPKTEEPKSDLLKGFEDSAKKMADLKIGGLEKKPKIELGKSEETGVKKLFDFKPSILGKFISEGKTETEKEPEEEKKGRFSKIKDAFVKSFIEPKAEEQTFVLPEEGYTPNEISTEEGLANIDKTAHELGVNQEELKNIVTEEAQPQAKLETELKIDTSEVENLNVKNLNIGDAFDKFVSTIKLTPAEQKKIEPEKGAQLSKQEQIRQLEQQGLVGEATAGEGVYFKPQTQKSLAAEQAMAQTTPKPVVTPVPTPNINIDAVQEEENKKLVEEAQQEQLKTLEDLRLKDTLPKGKKRGLFSKKSAEPEEPSAYEGYKKLLEEISGAEIVGQGEEAFFLTPEMIEEGKKGSELIGPEKQEPKIPTIQTPSKEEPKPIGAGMANGEANMRFHMAFGRNPEDLKELYPKAYDNINRNASFGKLPGEEFELPELTKEQEDIMLGGDIGIKQTTKLEEKYYDMKAEEGRREIKKFEEEKLAAARKEGRDTMSDEDLDILKSMKARTNDYTEKGLAINIGDVESFNKKIKPIGLEPKSELAPIKPALASLPIPEKEEKQPLGKRLKEGIGELKEKFKGKQEEEKPIAAVPETTKTFVARDAEGNIVGESIDRETARKMAGGKAITVEEENQTVTPSAPETPAVGVEKAVAEAKEKTPFKERLKDSFKKLIEEKPDESETKITIEEPTKIESITPETPSVGVEQVESEVEEPKTLRERIEGGADKLGSGIEKFAGKIGEKFERGKIKSKIDEIRGKIKPQEETTKIEPIKEDMFPLSKGFGGPFYEMKDGKLQMRDPYEMLDEKEKKEKESPKIEPIKPKTELTLSEGDKKFQEERQRRMEEESKIISSVQTDAYGKPVKIDKTEDEKIDSKAIEEAAPKVEDTKSTLGKISLTAAEGEEEGIIEPVSEITEDGNIKLLSGKPGEVKEPEETEIQKTIREAREKQLAFLEELRLKEQTPETPARGIEKLAEMGQKFGGLFRKKEEPGITTPEINYEEEETFEGYEPTPEEPQITPTETIESGFETETPELIQEGIPEDLAQIALPSPIASSPQGEYGETGGEAKTGETGEKVMTVEGGSPIVIEVKHTFNGLPSTIDTAQLSKLFETNYPLQQAMSTAVKRAATELGLTA